MLWKKVMPRLSAGRVQSVATRLVVERERERMAFVAAEYWDLEGTFDPGDVHARGSSPVDGSGSRRAGTSTRDGHAAGASVVQLDERGTARGLAERSRAAPFIVAASSRSRTRAGRPRRS